MYCGNNFIIGDTNEDGSRFLPFEDDLMRYDLDTHQYYLKTSGIKTKLGIDLSSLVATPLTDLVVLDEISDQIYEEIKDSANIDYPDTVEFKAARWIKSRDGIYRAMIAQLRYAYRTGKNLQEYGDAISNRALTILRSQQYGSLSFKGSSLLVKKNPDNPALPYLDDDNGWRNGY
jgi:hypothetical protein